MAFKFKTIQALSSGIYKDKGSKFISFAIPVTNQEQIKEIVNSYAIEYYDARHVCYAYMLGSERDVFRSNDNGEPSGTAGKPILGQINSHQLTNILIIVVRYFGGILLGTSGLINAYKEAAINAISNAQIIEVELKSTLNLHFEYLLLNDVMGVCKYLNAEINEQIFDNKCFMQISIKMVEEKTAISKFEKIVGLRIEKM